MSLEIAPSFWDHVEELRKTIVYCLITVALSTLCVFLCFDWLYPLITSPLQTGAPVQKVVLSKERILNPHPHSVLVPLSGGSIIQLSEGAALDSTGNLLLTSGAYVEIEKESPKLILLGPLEGISTTIKICFWLSCALSSPVWGILLMRFILPGLKSSERSLALPFLCWSIAALGLAFVGALSTFIPLTNQVLETFNQSLGQNLWSVSHYLNFTLMMIFSVMIAAELVVILFFLVHYGKVEAHTLTRWRPVVYVGLFILCAIITPPDIVTQIALALPMTALFEASIVYAKIQQFRKGLILRHVD